MIPALIVFAYLAVVLYIGIFAFRKTAVNSGEDFFVASRKLGPVVFLLSLFGTNMTAVAILGSSGFAYQRGIGVYGLMASSSGIIIPITLWLIGTRLWALGKKHGHITQVGFLRDRWESGGIATFIAILTAVMLVPYIIIGVMGGGSTLETISGGLVPYAVGGAVVAVTVMSYVFFGGMRGTAWVNTFQTILFLAFGITAFTLIAKSVGGFPATMNEIANGPQGFLLTRERMPAEEFFSYMFIPLSAIMFPHIAIMCMTAEKVTHFKRTVILYPICILLIWLPSVYLGVVASKVIPGLTAAQANDVIIRLLSKNTSEIVAGILGAGIMACVMASDSQILALSTVFTEDLFSYYGGRKKFGPKGEVWAGRAFILLIGTVSYLIALALKDKANIFELAIRFAFSGFAALAPIMLAAMFWKRSTKWGALASSVWVLACVLGNWYLTAASESIAPKPPMRKPAAMAQVEGANPVGAPLAMEKTPPTAAATTPGTTPSEISKIPGGPKGPGSKKPPTAVRIYPGLGDMFLRGPVNVTVYGYLPVLPMVLGSALLMLLVSLLTPAPSKATIDKYFQK
ncbi:MAG: sodium:solute symporter family protein [Planctomycetota bacterium]|nr:MAG: sodium:solute symporter family protein [Planctomycetota bacterium]